MRIFFTLAFAFISLFSAPSVLAAESEPVDTGRVVAQLVSSHDSAEPGSTIHVALSTVIDHEWHTYWKNPGDSGEPVSIYWAENPLAAFGDIIWPLPATIPTGPIINYGFEGRVLFPVPVKISEDAVPGTTLFIDADVTYLVCKDVCIPESTSLSIEIEIGDKTPDGRWGFNIEQAIADAPPQTDQRAGLAFENGQLEFTFASTEPNISYAYFFAENPEHISHSKPQLMIRGEKGFKLVVPAGYGLEKGLDGQIKGVLRTETKDGGAKGVWLTADPATKIDIGPIQANAMSGGNTLTLWSALIGAFLGGLVLNLMPCVFPIISMKALSFAKIAHEDRGQIRRQGWLYTAGVIATFLALTILLLVLKSLGSQIGWGFQLQNPVVIGALALLFFAIGLNLLGAYDIELGWENTGSDLARGPGWAGAFFTGALAVIVATPCTAPFMAGAIGFAFVQPAIITLIVFMALAIGFALPFLLLSYWPALLQKLPKPGPWMDVFKKVLGFMMLAAVIWLVWVLSLQTGSNGTGIILTAFLTFGVAVFAFAGKSKIAKAVALIALLLSAGLVLKLKTDAGASQKALTHEAWSPEKIQQLRGEGKNVFVDFTAAWCVSCKVNEITVLNGAADIFEETNTVMLVADWTNKNDVIAAELQRHGRSGVPLYLYYTAGHNPVSPDILPQILTRSMLKKTFEGTAH